MVRKKKTTVKNFVHRLTPEYIEQTSRWTAEMKMNWPEEANEFINNTLGLEKRARFDPRFKVFLKKSRWAK